jgi:hypothetical protein
VAGAGTRSLAALFCGVKDPLSRECRMRAVLVFGFLSLVLAACCSCPPQQQPTVVVPSGAAVVCPNGSPAVVSNGVYRC